MHSIIRERLHLIIDHTVIIMSRLQHIKSADDFVATESGTLLLDAIITRLQAIGENFKKIEKITPSFIQEELLIDVTPVIRFRDLSSHHYEILNHRIIYAICKEEIPTIQETIASYLQTNKTGH